MRPILLAVGLALLLFAWSLLEMPAGHTFWGHMTAHMTVVAFAAPLLAFSIGGARQDPVRRAPWLFSPLAASMLELALVWLWHMPALHLAARESLMMRIAEQGSFLFAGLYLWLSIFGGSLDHAPARRAEGIVALVLTAMHMTLLGALLGLAPRSLYGGHTGHGALNALDDQQLGGAIMILLGGVSYLAGGLWLTAQVLGQRRSACR